MMQSFRFFLGLAAFMVSMIYFGAAGCQKRATSGRLGAVAANVGSAVTSSSKTGAVGKGGSGGGGGGYGGTGANSNVGGAGGGDNGVGGAGGGDNGVGGYGGSGIGGMSGVVGGSDGTGNCLWVKGFGDSADDFGYAIATDGQDNIIVAGAFHEGINLGDNQLTSGGQADACVANSLRTEPIFGAGGMAVRAMLG